MKKLFAGIIIGAVLVQSSSVIASQIQAFANRFPIYVNGTTRDIKAYNINGSTYLKLSDLTETTGLDVSFKSEAIYINSASNSNTTPTKPSTQNYTGDYASVPSFESVSLLKPHSTDKGIMYNRVSYEYKTKDARNLRNKYAEVFVQNGFQKITGVDSDLDFDNDNDDFDDYVYKKGNIYVSIDADDDDDIEINMATKN